MPLSLIQTPFTSNELAAAINANNAYLDSTKADASALANYILASEKGANNGVATLNSSGLVIQKALSAVTADDYNATSGTIKTKFDSIDLAITNITNGTTIIGYARDLSPLTPPGNNKFYGTSGSGVIGWYDVPTPEEGIAGPSTEPFTSADARWSAPVSGIVTLTIPHSGKYAFDVYKQDGSVYSRIEADVQRDATNIYVRAMNTFTGYVLVM